MEGNINPEQTGDLCFIGERKGIHMCPHEIKGKRQRNEIDNLIVLFCYKLVKKSQMMDNPFQFRVLLKSHTRSKHLESLEGIIVYYYGILPRIL